MTIKIPIISTYSDKGTKQATKSISGLESTLKKLGPIMAAAFSTTAIISFGKASVRAFIADDKALKSLNQTLKNTGNMYATTGVTKFIGDLEKQTGVLDDKLRPAFQTLLTATGSVTKSQEALTLALDISAGTGKDLTAVAMALSKGYLKQTTAIGRLGAGISKATLASGDMKKITAELSSLFTGQAATAADTYAGKMGKLNVAAENAKETIGKGLIDAFALLGDDKSIDDLIEKIGTLAQDIADIVVGIGLMTAALKKIPGASTIGTALTSNAFTLPLMLLKDFGARQRQSVTPSGEKVSSANLRGQAAASRAALKILKDKNALSAIEAANLKAKLLAEADQKTLDLLKKKFDIDRIQITAALAATTDEHTRAVLQGQLAILDGDAKAAQASMDRLASLDETRKVSEFKRAELSDAAAEQLKVLGTKIDAVTNAFNNLGFKTVALEIGTNDAAKGLAAFGAGATAMGNTLANWRAGERYTPPNIPNAPSVPVIPNMPGSNPGGGERASDSYVMPNIVPAVTPAPSFIGGERDFIDTITAIEQASAAIVEYQNFRAGERGDTYNVTVNAGVVGSEQVIANEVQKVLQNFNRFGSSTNYAGSIDQ